MVASPFPLAQVVRRPMPSVQIVDVGAMAEGIDRYAPLVSQGLAQVLGFEPNPVELAKLRAQAEPHCKYLPYFLGRGGPATFHKTIHPGCCSLYAPDETTINLFNGLDMFDSTKGEMVSIFEVRETHAVETHRLDDIRECTAPDYLKLDVQGAEWDVLEGASRTLESVLVIDAEVEFVPLYREQPLFGDVQVQLRRAGFVFHKFIDVAGRAFRPMTYAGRPNMPLSQLLWADAVFVRDFRKPDLLTPEQLLKLALILHDVYLSYDLVHHVLQALDGRAGSSHASDYLAELGTIKGARNLLMNYRVNR